MEVVAFIQMGGFVDEWENLKLSDEDLRILELTIMARPTNAPVVPGTGGLRKMRYSPERWKKGKRGGLRICYVFFKEFSIVLLVTVYSKRDKDDLSPDGKKRIKQFIERQKKQLAQDQ